MMMIMKDNIERMKSSQIGRCKKIEPLNSKFIIFKLIMFLYCLLYILVEKIKSWYYSRPLNLKPTILKILFHLKSLCSFSHLKGTCSIVLVQLQHQCLFMVHPLSFYFVDYCQLQLGHRSFYIFILVIHKNIWQH